jgi:CubicO group peptidase (beta-lactamase class C family)
MLLNGGAYGGRRILSRASVAAMTRPQADTTIPFTLPMINAAGERMDVDRSGTGYGYGLFHLRSG